MLLYHVHNATAKRVMYFYMDKVLSSFKAKVFETVSLFIPLLDLHLGWIDGSFSYHLDGDDIKVVKPVLLTHAYLQVFRVNNYPYCGKYSLFIKFEFKHYYGEPIINRSWYMFLHLDQMYLFPMFLICILNKFFGVC